MTSIQEIQQKILNAHASTRERLAYLDEFVATIVELVKHDDKIIDIGAGVFPLAVPLDALTCNIYLAIENQTDSVEALKVHEKVVPRGVFKVFDGTFTDIDWSTYLNKNEEFDTALMLKLISVVRRKDKAAFHRLAEVPARTYLVSVPKTSLTKNEDITRKEIAKVKEFAGIANKEVVDKYDFPDEVLYVLR